jgi:hypothetical protein
MLRRQLKVIGVIGSNSKDNITYLNLLSQIADARANKYSDDEIARAVRKAISATSHLRTYFDTQVNIDLRKMVNIIRDFYQERTASELFQSLGGLCQQPQEKSTDFILRAFELRQKVIMAADAEGGLYDKNLVQDSFCRAVRTGIADPQVRAHMRPFLDPKAAPGYIGDEVLLHEINKAAAENEETTSKQKSSSTRKVTIAEASTKAKDEPPNEGTSAIKPLVEGLAKQLEELTKQVNELQNQNRLTTQNTPRAEGSYPPESTHNTPRGARGYSRETTRYTQRGERSYRCNKCRDHNAARCGHCFHCGRENHRARDCPEKN